jgi:putative thioredoxin
MHESDDLHFETDVLEASRERPILVDFWAPWCGPCRALGPVLERVEAAMAGAIRVVKVNADDNPEASARYGVRSIPFVVAFRDGKPVDQFVGALPEGQVRAFVERLAPKPGEAEHARARTLAASGRTADQVDALREALALNPSLDAARREYVRALVSLGRADEARRAFEPLAANRKASLPDAALAQLLDAADEAANGPAEAALRATIGKDPADVDARYALARRLLATGRWAEAIDELLEVIRRDRSFRDDLARLTMLAVFELCDDAALVGAGRRRLGAALN